MPKINVYLPEKLAAEVKAAEIPVSAVCQRALERVVREVGPQRETIVFGPPAIHLREYRRSPGLIDEIMRLQAKR